MPRRSSRPGPAVQAPEAAPKRRASARLSASEVEVKRVKSNIDLSDNSQVKSTAKKSKYFEPDSSEDPEESSGNTDGDESDSVYEEKEDGDSDEDDHEPSDLDEPDSEEEVKKSKAKTGPGRVSDAAASLKGKELWREGVRTGLAPGQEVFIAKPKARDAGGVPYKDETLHPNTRLFLMDLAKNNDRQWLKGT